MKQTPWIERKFNFDFPPGIFPCILDRLRGTPARLDEKMRSIPSHFLKVQVDGKWSIQEHVGHLADLDELHDGRIDDYLSGASILRAADMSNQKTSVANHNSKSIKALLHSFREKRYHFLGRLEKFDDTILSRSALHPRLQIPMRVVDMAYFVAEHDDHHLARISEVVVNLQMK